MSLNHRECHWIQCGNMTSWQLAEWVGTHVPVFRQMQFNDYAKYLGVMVGPAELPTGGRIPETNFLPCMPAVVRPHRVWLKHLYLVKFVPYLFSRSLVPWLNLIRTPCLRKLQPSKNFRLDPFTCFLLQCSGEEVPAASKLMLMVPSSQGRPPDFELLSVPCLCRPVWHVSLPRKNILEELIFHMGLGTKIPQIVDGSLHDGCFSAGQQN